MFRNTVRNLAAASLSLAVALPALAAEPAACQGLADRDREVVARLPRDIVEGVEPIFSQPLVLEPPVASVSPASLRGATVAVRPVPGLSAERLQRIVECGLAKNGQTDWPAVTAGTVATVRSGGDRFLVDLVAAREKDAQGVLEAARRLLPKA